MQAAKLNRAKILPSRCVVVRAGRRADYSSRRSGSDEENRRRSRTSREFGSSTPQNLTNGAGPSNTVQRSTGSARPSPATLRRRSVDYSSRRPGNDEENARRGVSRDYQSPTRRSSTVRHDTRRRHSTDYGSSSAYSSSPASDPPSAPTASSFYNPTTQTPTSSVPPRRTSNRPPIVPKRRSADYASRRSGSQEENRRRSGGYSPPTPSYSSPPPTDSAYDSDSGYTSTEEYDGSTTYEFGSSAAAPRQQESLRRTSRPRIVPKRRSSDYPSRRPGNQEENQRRSGNFQSPTPARRRSASARVTPSPSTSYRDDPPPPEQTRRMSRPRIVPKRRSSDYPSRRPGNQEENQRRSGNFQSPDGRAGGSESQRQAPVRVDPPRTPVRRPSSTDYSSRRAGSQEENLRRRSSGDFVPLSQDGERAPPPQRRQSVQPQRRSSGAEYASRRNNTQEENMRRRSVDMISGDVLEPEKEGPPRSVSARRNSSGSAAPSYADSEPPSWQPAASTNNSAGDEPIRKVKATRRQSFVPAAEGDYTPPGYEEPPPPLPYNPAYTDWPRIIALNIPSAFAVLVGLIIVDFNTGFDLTRVAVRYGGPGAPPLSVASFWIGAVGLTGVISTLLTSVVSPEAYVLKAQCPDCGAPVRGNFGGTLGRKGNRETAALECDNCMADLRFMLEGQKVVLERDSQSKKAEALERGRQQALRVARSQAADAQAEARKYMDGNK